MAQNLVYFLAETHSSSQKHSVLVATLIGSLVKRNAAIFRECMEEVIRSKSVFVVMNFRDVPGEIDPGFLHLLSDLRQSFQSGGITLKFSGVHPKLRGAFVEAGIARAGDFSDNLAGALEAVAVIRNAA
jgi:anti-anti-sigma regulatory factor